MEENEEIAPALVIEYVDPEEGFKGWLAIDTLAHQLCAGGMRVQPGLTRAHLAAMARNMTRKMQICGLRVDGAKCGIDYDPAGPGKHAAMGRFMAAVKPYIMTRYSMGPDLNVEMGELEAIGRGLGIPAVKMAIAGAQGWDLDYFLARYRILNQEIDGWPLGRVRAGYGVAAASLAVLQHLGIPPEQASAAIQGFGALSRAAAWELDRKGVRIMALADREKCLVATSPQGLDVKRLLASPGSLLPLPGGGTPAAVRGREEINAVACDLLVPAAVENLLTEEVASRLQVKAVVPGANLAVTPGGERVLQSRGILALPDFLAGCGGSLSMEGLFGAKEHPHPAEVLGHVAHRLAQIINRVLARSREEKIPPALAALRCCGEARPQPGARPYGDPG